MTKTCFSTSYAQARSRFRAASAAAGATLEEFTHPSTKALDDSPLSIDIALLGPRDAKRLLVVLCGVHGLEAAAGAATMMQWLTQGGPDKSPEDAGVLLVHGVNPYGWAHASRGDENNIDLNRNCLPHEEGHPNNPGYRALHDMIVSADGDPSAFDRATEQFHVFRLHHGASAALQAVTAGQYDIPNGLSYGGRVLTWSSRTVLDLLAERCQRAEKVVIIDGHTGIGDFGEPFFITRDNRESANYARARQWWGAEYIHSGDVFAGAETPNYTGTLVEAAEARVRAASGAKVLGIAVEWGTYSVDVMLQALLMDRWLRFACPDPSAPEATSVRSRMIERFCPSAPGWQNSILIHAARIYDQALVGLTSW